MTLQESHGGWEGLRIPTVAHLHLMVITEHGDNIQILAFQRRNVPLGLLLDYPGKWSHKPGVLVLGGTKYFSSA